MQSLTKDQLKAAALALPPAERLEFIQELWSTLMNTEVIEVTGDDVEQATKRLAQLRKDPQAQRPFDEILRDFGFNDE